MKRILATLFCMSILLSLVGCGEETVTVNPETPPLTNEAETETAEEAQVSTAENGLLPYTYQVPFNEIYIDVPPYVLLEEGYSNIYWDNDVKYAAFTCLYHETAADLQDSYEQNCTEFLFNIHDDHCVNEIDKVTKEEVTVNGIDTIRLQGTANCGRETLYDAYIYGYAFIINEHPCSIIGVVKDVSQPQQEIDSVTELVDAMMATVRNEL